MADNNYINDSDLIEINNLVKRARYYSVVHMNEKTLWARVIYPLLVMAESGDVVVASELSLEVQNSKLHLCGTVDDLFGKCVEGDIEKPYLVISQTKRDKGNENIRFQVYGQMLVAAFLNHKHSKEGKQEIFGCYTIADI